MRGAEPPSSLMTSCTNFLLLWPPLLMSVATVELGVPLWLERELLRLCFLEAENKLAVESVLTLVTPSLGLLRDVSVMDIALVSASLLGDEPELELIIETDTWRETPEIVLPPPSSREREISSAESSAACTLSLEPWEMKEISATAAGDRASALMELPRPPRLLLLLAARLVSFSALPKGVEPGDDSTPSACRELRRSGLMMLPCSMIADSSLGSEFSLPSLLEAVPSCLSPVTPAFELLLLLLLLLLLPRLVLPVTFARGILGPRGLLVRPYMSRLSCLSS